VLFFLIDIPNSSRRATNGKQSDAKFLSEVEKQVEERLKQQEESMQQELKQLRRQTVMPDSEAKVLAEIDPKHVVKHFSVGKGCTVLLLVYSRLSLLILPLFLLRAFGEVFKGLLHGKEVAIKQLLVKDKLNDEVLDEFRKEVQIMMYAISRFYLGGPRMRTLPR